MRHIKQLQFATHDRNGNPRKMWCLWDEDGIIRELCNVGYGNVPQDARWKSAVNITPASITVAEFNDWKRVGNSIKILTYGG